MRARSREQGGVLSFQGTENTWLPLANLPPIPACTLLSHCWILQLIQGFQLLPVWGQLMGFNIPRVTHDMAGFPTLVVVLQSFSLAG